MAASRSTVEKGREAESIAVKYLENKGYEILLTNFYSIHGEIDIICVERNTLVFVEVKSSKKDAMIDPLFWIDKKKQVRMTKTAMDYLSKKNIDKDIRFDAIIMKSDAEKNWSIDHIQDAFRPEADI